MELAARIGLRLDEWQQMTPRELRIWADAYLTRERAREREAKVMIYDLAGLTRTMIWSNHPPQFDAVFPEKKEPMDDETMYATVKALNRLFGGKEE